MSCGGRISKAELRRQLRAKRNALTEADRAAWSSAIVDRWLQAEPAHPGQTVMAYLSAGSEVGTRGLIDRLWGGGVTVFLPRIEPGNMERGVMEAAELRRWEELEPGPFGLMQPPKAPLDPSVQSKPIHVALVPGLGFTADGNRVGQGGGFYDRWLARHPEVRAVGLAFSSQLLEAVPSEPHDRRMDAVLTESGIHACTPDA